MRSVLISLSILMSAAALLAQPQQSANFRITKSVLDASGGYSASTNFRLQSALGQPTPVGVASSANFVLTSGFLSPSFAVSPLSPIQRLVILPQNPNVLLSWERITGAAHYKVYRSTDPLFAPSPTSLLGTAADTSFTDLNVIPGPNLRDYYIVTAVDVNGLLMTISTPPATRALPPRETMILPHPYPTKQGHAAAAHRQ
jgi:hypothetical protein